MSFEKIAEELMKLLEETDELTLNNVDLVGKQIEFHILPQMVSMASASQMKMLQQFASSQAEVQQGKLTAAEWIETKFPEIINENTGKIEEITFKRRNGKEVKIGGETVPPYLTFFGKKNPNRPIVALDVFDYWRSFPKPIKVIYKDVGKDPVKWAQKAEKFGADLLTFHTLATDPLIMDRPAKEDGKIYEEMLQQTKVPIIIGGSGNKKKDPIVYKELGRIAHEDGTRSMLSSADAETWEEVIPIANKYDQNVLLWTQLDINNQVKLNKDCLEKGLKRDRIVMDPTCATLGYGLEYSYSIYQRMRISGLMGDEYLAFPMSGGTTNAWGAREAWMSTKKAPQWGDQFKRGPLWEVTTALALSLCGLDLAMMFHPLAAQTFKNIAIDFFTEAKKSMPTIEEWVTMKI
ncbi:MAG: CO dehydrogenase/acetyl-CoA synthase subunit delta [Promethearchaeota archaeon]